MDSTSGETMEVDLTRYEDLWRWQNPQEVIDWTGVIGWTAENPHKLCLAWLKDKVRRIADRANRASSSMAERGYGGIRLLNHECARLQDMKDLTCSARKILFRVFPTEFGRFVSAAKEYQAWLPVTIHRDTGSRQRSEAGDEEPCGAVVSPYNLGPEWIRHFMGVLYDKSHFTKTTATGKEGFFPFANQDHLVHSFLVALMGEVLLNAPVDDNAKMAVTRALGCPSSEVEELHTVRSLAEKVYTYRCSDILPPGVSASRWVRRVWPAVAFWHDAGYDAATWCMLTFREFSHSFALQSIIQSGHIAREVFGHVQSIMGDDLAEPIHELLNHPPARADASAYCHLWYTDECHIQDKSRRPWGRFHALFSAYEFAQLLALRLPDTVGARETKHLAEEGEIKHFVAAIAGHHEQGSLSDVAESGGGDECLAEAFVKNPVGAILPFADAMAGFARVKVKDAPADGNSVPIVDEYLHSAFDSTPLRIWLPNGKLRPRFYRGKHPPALLRDPSVKMKALWGEFLEDSPGADAPTHCPRRSRNECKLHGS